VRLVVTGGSGCAGPQPGGGRGGAGAGPRLAAEQRIAESALNWTILRPVPLTFGELLRGIRSEARALGLAA
jgi:hypothetical protein